MVEIKKIQKGFAKWYRIEKEDLSNELFEFVEFGRDLDFLSLPQARKIKKIIKAIRLFLLYKTKRGEEVNNFKGSDILEMLEEWRDLTKGRGSGYVWDSFRYFFKDKPKETLRRPKGSNAWDTWKHWKDVHSFIISYTPLMETKKEKLEEEEKRNKEQYGEGFTSLELEQLREKYRKRAEKAKKTIREKKGF